jgi:hypothetical protein
MTDRDCVYCAVRAEYLRMIQEMLGLEMLVLRPLISSHFILFCFFNDSSGINHIVRSFSSPFLVDRSLLLCIIGHCVTTVPTSPSLLNQRPPRFYYSAGKYMIIALLRISVRIKIQRKFLNYETTRHVLLFSDRRK